MCARILIILFYFADCCLGYAEQKAGMQVCPRLLSKFNGSVDELLGNWHVALLILDETEEKFEEESVCIQGRIYKVNATNLVQMWNVQMPEIVREEKTEVDFPTKIIEPGVWLVQSPLGGQFQGTIIDSDGVSYLLIVYCGWQDEKLVHMMTVALSRNSVVTPPLKLQLLTSLVQNGYDPFKTKIVSWRNC